jgi:hypothetical protein
MFAGRRILMFGNSENREAFFDGQPALLLRVAAVSDQAGGFKRFWVIVRFDQDYLRSKLIPPLLEQFATGGKRPEFEGEMRSRDSGGATSEGPVAVELFRYRPDCFSERMARVDAAPHFLAGLDPREPSHFQVPGNAPVSSIDRLLKSAGHCQARPPGLGRGLFLLIVRRTELVEQSLRRISAAEPFR